MDKVKVIGILFLLIFLCEVNSYQVGNLSKIQSKFGSEFAPPLHSKNDKELNEFLELAKLGCTQNHQIKRRIYLQKLTMPSKKLQRHKKSKTLNQRTARNKNRDSLLQFNGLKASKTFPRIKYPCHDYEISCFKRKSSKAKNLLLSTISKE